MFIVYYKGKHEVENIVVHERYFEYEFMSTYTMNTINPWYEGYLALEVVSKGSKGIEEL